MTDSLMSPFEKAQILLAEYTALRNEVLQQAQVETQLWFVGATVLVTVLVAIVGVILALKGDHIDGLGRIALAVLIAIFFIVWTVVIIILEGFVLRSRDHLAKRLTEIEEQINGLAGQELLLWERKKGVLAIGYKERWASLASKNKGYSG